MSKVWIGNFFPDSKMYNEEAGETVGDALLNGRVANNRYSLKGVMNKHGVTGVKMVERMIRTRVGLDAKLYFSRKAGCSSCPCSPGFMIKVEVPKNKVEDVRGLFGKWTVLTRYSNGRGQFGPREVGIQLWGSVKAGKVKVNSNRCKDVTDKAVKEIRNTLRSKP